MLNKYIYCECTTDYWPEIKVIMAKSYNDAVEKVIQHYFDKFDDDNIINIDDDFEKLQEYLNEKYTIALSNIEDIEEL